MQKQVCGELSGELSGNSERREEEVRSRAAKPLEGNLFKRRPICTSIGLLVPRWYADKSLFLLQARDPACRCSFLPRHGKGGGHIRWEELVSKFSKLLNATAVLFPRFVSPFRTPDPAIIRVSRGNPGCEERTLGAYSREDRGSLNHEDTRVPYVFRGD